MDLFGNTKTQRRIKMPERTPNLTKIVAWFLEKKALIKFADDEKSYKLAENVIKANDFEKFPIRKGDVVEIGLTADVITFLRKAKSQTPKVENRGSEEAYEPTAEEEKPKTVVQTPAPAPKVEEPKKEVVTPSVVGDEKVLTVYAIAANKKVVKFLEIKDSGWFQIDPSIQAQDYKVIGLEAKRQVKVKIVENMVVSVSKVASEPAETPKTTTSSPENAKVEPTAAPAAQAPVKATEAPKREWKPYSQNPDVQKSIECQACVNSASNLVGMVAANIDPKPTASVINAMIRAIATENYSLLQELKSK